MKNNERWTTNDQLTKVVDEINYLEFTLENAGGLNKQKTRLRAKYS
jgi:hypothetical protein